jgi:hypothetical protein
VISNKLLVPTLERYRRFVELAPARHDSVVSAEMRVVHHQELEACAFAESASFPCAKTALSALFRALFALTSAANVLRQSTE